MEETSIRKAGDFSGPHGRAIAAALDSALALDAKLPEWILQLDGMSGRSYRRLINALVSNVDTARYLEVGSWAGSTACSAIHGNAVRATCIDNWSEFGGPKDLFLHHTAQAGGGGGGRFHLHRKRFSRCRLYRDRRVKRLSLRWAA